MEDREAFCEFLSHRQPPRSLSESTADDAIEFLLTLPSDRLNKAVSHLSKATFDGDQKENPFASPMVRTFLQERVKEQANEKEYGDKKLNPGGGESEVTGRYHDDDKENLFEKYLTTSDLNNLDSYVVAASEDAGKYFRLATVVVGGTEWILRVEDEEGKPWQFRFDEVTKDWNSFVLTKGWSNFIKEKQLGPGDFVFFQRLLTDSSRLFIGFRRRQAALGQWDYLRSQDLTSLATSSKTLELTEVETPITPLQLRMPEHSITGSDPILVIYCGDNQDSEERYFISYISNELCLRGFTPLIYDLTRSTVTGNLEMLHRSRFGIIIFSRNYACSRQCLDEFVAIVDHSKENNLVLLPVFFKVKVADIRGRSGSFGRAFSRLENSVHTLTSINKYQYMKGYEVILAKNIVRDVCLLLNSEANMKLIGSLQMKSILSILNCSQFAGPRIVGLWGMAGIGKTTITREIFRTQAERYDVCYFLPDFNIVRQTRRLSHLRDEFFSKISGEENVIIDACDTKLSFTRDRFLSKKVLIVLDGVSNARVAEDLVGGFGWFSGGHTIVLTSRNRQVLVQCNAKEIYEIQKLSERESLHLCCQFATEQNWKGSTSLISELVNYASGIPLALCVLGSSLQNQCINDEKQHLKRLRQHPLIEIQEAFKRSFDVLDGNEKNTFLDLACFFRGEDKDHVANILDGCGFQTDLGIYGLIDESLISLVDNTIEIPNIFQDAGRFVVCQENNETCKRSRLWDPNDIVDVLTNNSGTEAIEGLFLDATGLTFELSPTAFEKMYRLRLLKLYCPTSENHCKVCLPKGLYSLPDELRLLHWERYPLGSLPRNFNPKNLVELNMPYSNMTKLWKGTKNLEKLKRIILSHSRQLIKFPRLSKAKDLEHIDLEGCTSLVKVNSSILHHHKLSFLSLKDCSHLRIMPTTVHLEALEVLNLSGCSELEDFPDFSPSLKELYLAGTAIREMSSSIGGLTRLVTLDLENCNRLQQLPPEISNLKVGVSLSAKRPAPSMNLSSVGDTAPPYKRCRLKRVIESVVMSLRKRKRENSDSRIVNEETEEEIEVREKLVDDDNDSYQFHHPKDKETTVPECSFSLIGLPLRPGAPVCAFYFRTGICRDGPTCIFDHPSLIPTHKNASLVFSETAHLNQLGFSSSIGDSSSEFVEASTKKPRIHRNASSMASETLHLSPLGFSSSIGDSSSELVEASTKKPRIHKNASSMASETLHLSPLGFSSSIGDSSSELVEASTKKPRIHKNASSMASETLHLSPLGFSSSIGDSSSELVEASTKKPRIHKNASSMASETLHLSPLGFYSSAEDSSSEPVEASTKKPRIHKNASSMASETLHLSPLGFYSSAEDSSSEPVEASTKKPIIHKNASSMASEKPRLRLLRFSILIGDSSSERVETSTVSEITQANVGRDITDSWGVSEEDIRFWLRL